MNTFTLKLLALILMTLDHIALYFPAAPVWFGWLGGGGCKRGEALHMVVWPAANTVGRRQVYRHS